MKTLTLAACMAASIALPAQADVFMFETPSGNIQCSVGIERDFSDVSCEIVQTNAAPPRPRPATCAAAWGFRYSMGDRGPVKMECAPYPRDFDISEKAPYGVTGEWGGVACHSSTSGLRCWNSDGHGFMLSRRVIQVF